MSGLDSFEDVRRYRVRMLRRYTIVISLTVACMIAAFIGCMAVGNYHMSPAEVWNALTGKGSPGAVQVVRRVRLPRVIAAAFVGAGLSVAGLAMQSLFKNPMASPSILGISAGAAFGASVSISFGIGAGLFGSFATPALAFIMCFATMGLVYLISASRYGISTVTLLLAGVAVGSFFNGMVSLMQYVADENTLASIIYWTMGSFNKATWDNLVYSFIPVFLGVLTVAVIYRELNLISAGEEQAANLGVNVKRTRAAAIVATSLCVGGAVSIAGTIGFVGLIIPHIFRMLVGPDHKVLIPLCIFGGATFLMLMDTIAKAAFEISFPVGIFTSLLGAPFFVFILRRRKKEMWE